MDRVDWLICPGWVVPVVPRGLVIERGALAVRDGEIVAVGSADDLRARYLPARTVDAPETVAIPGLVNAHTHAAMTLFRGVVDDLALEPWLARVWKLEPVFATYENVALGAEAAFAEMISSGTTCAADMYWHPEAAAETALRVGFRFVGGGGAIDVLNVGTPERRSRAGDPFIERYLGSPTLHPCVQVHAVYSVKRETLETARVLVERYGVPFITHASESRAEVADVQARFGKTPIEYLDDVGLLRPGAMLAHAVHLRDDEIALLAARGAAVAHCLESNLKLGNGVARVLDLLRAGVTVALGTDGAASNNDLDLLGEMHAVALVHKGLAGDPTVLPAWQALEAATLGGAKALGLGERIGSLQPGKRADLTLVGLDRLRGAAVYDVLSHLVYAAHASDVRSVFVEGRPLLLDGAFQTLDVEEVARRMRQVTGQIRAAL